MKPALWEQLPLTHYYLPQQSDLQWQIKKPCWAEALSGHTHVLKMFCGCHDGDLWDMPFLLYLHNKRCYKLMLCGRSPIGSCHLLLPFC